MAVLAIAVAGVLIWFFSPGIHVLFGFVHIDLSMEGDIIQDGAVIGQATLNAAATAAPKSSFSSLDHIEIDGCPAFTEEKGVGSYTMQHSDGIMMVVFTIPLLSEDPEIGLSITGSENYFIYIDEDTKEIVSAQYLLDSDENGTTKCYLRFDTSD